MRTTRILILTLFILAVSASPVNAVVTCGSTPYTAADVAAETANWVNNVPGAICIFIYNTTIYQPPQSTMSQWNNHPATNHHGHPCGQNVTGGMEGSHNQNPSHYLIPYVCAPLGSGGDTQAPTVPTNVTATATGPTSINVTWNASTDNTAVTGYNVDVSTTSNFSSFVSGWNNHPITSGTSTPVTGLTASTTYYVRVSAYDAANNTSGESSTASATTQAAADTTPPTAPTLTASGPTTTSFHLSWSGATDNVGVTAYHVDVSTDAGFTSFVSGWNNTNVNNVTQTDITGLSSGTQYYSRVRAYDAAGNPSPNSNTGNVTTTGACVPTTETCNGVDDDCDGQVDEGLSNQATCGVGACQVSVTQSCSAGAWTPACVAGNPTTESCNQIDDNCNSAVDEGGVCGACTPGTTMACGSSTGACEQGTQTCSAGGTWGACTGNVDPITEICGNGIDDNCNAAVDEGCTNDTGGTTNTGTNGGTTDTGGTSSSNNSSSESTLDCVPQCPEKCGQENGCDGFCSNAEIYTAGKCFNPACTPSCAGAACGQSNGCGGICPDFDQQSCGLCGNAPCCTEEACFDGKDNDCDGVIDNSCDVLSLAGRTIGSTGGEIAMDVGQIPAYVSQSAFQARVAGIAAFFFAGFTLLIGIFRFQLINRFSRRAVITYHSIVGSFAVIFMVIHIVALLLDQTGKWAGSVDIGKILIPNVISDPNFSGFNIGLGSLGMYFLLLTIVSGALFVKIAHKIGYKKWLFIHRLSFLFYAFIFYHALKLGTDFQNPYIIVFFAQVFIIVAVYATYKLIRGRELKEQLLTAAKKIISTQGMRGVTLAQIANATELIGKRVKTSGTITNLPLQKDENGNWYQIYDATTSVIALSKTELPAGTYTSIQGIVQKPAEQAYLEITEAHA